MSENPTTVTYASAGVDVEAGDRAVELMKDAIKATHNSSVVGGVGGFAGLYDVSELVKYRKPYLATSTDGVGTGAGYSRHHRLRPGRHGRGRHRRVRC